MVSAEGTVLTSRQLAVLERREADESQPAIAADIDTTVANVSTIESAARENVEEAKRTVELVRTLRSSVHFTVESGAMFEEIVDKIYDEGDRADISITHTRPELQSMLFESLETHARGDQVETAIEIGIETDGSVEVYPNQSMDTTRMR
jgi:Tfx family DNA-binding protein